MFDVIIGRLLCPLLFGICRWCTKIVTLFCRKFTTGTTTRMEHKVYYWPKNSSSAERWAYGKKSSSFHWANWEKAHKSENLFMIFIWIRQKRERRELHAYEKLHMHGIKVANQPLGCHVLTSLLFPSVDRRVNVKIHDTRRHTSGPGHAA